jgi:hypothetical protein
MLSLSWARTQFTVCWSPPFDSQMSAGRPVRGVIAQATTKRGAKTIAEIFPTVTRISSLAIMVDVRGLRDRRGRKTVRPESFVGIFTFAQPFLHAACLCDRDGASVPSPSSLVPARIVLGSA